jgi:hypothetical protein
MQETEHSKLRRKQRHIKDKEIEYIWRYGYPRYKPGNVLEFRMTKKALREAINDVDNQDLLAQCLNKGIIVSPDNCMITAYRLR